MRCAVLAVSRLLTVGPLDAKEPKNVRPPTDEAAYRFEGDTYALALHLDGLIDLYARHDGEDFLLGTIGAFEMPACDVRSGPLLSVNRFCKTIPPADVNHDLPRADC